MVAPPFPAGEVIGNAEDVLEADLDLVAGGARRLSAWGEDEPRGINREALFAVRPLRSNSVPG